MVSQHEELARILASKSFSNAPQLSRFLRYLFQKTMEGQIQDLKESIIGTEVFGRPAGYDPRLDPVVRTEARRLRTKLAQYYESQTGTAGERVVIELPKGGYILAFRSVGGTESAIEVETLPQIDSTGFPFWRVAAGCAVLCAALLLLSVRAPGRHPQIADSVSVLPFETFGVQADSQYLAKGVAVEIAGRLGLDKRLRVIEAGSLDSPPSHPNEIRQLGSRLNASALLGGTLRLDGERLFITARLVDTSDAGERWSQSYSISRKELPGVEAEIVAGAFRGLGLVEATRKKSRKEKPVNPEMHDLYLRGRFVSMTQSPYKMQTAFDEFREAIRLDPESEWGYVGLADLLAVQISHRVLPPERIPEARTAALAAIERNPESAEAHAALGLLHYCEWDWEGALDEYRRSLEINPNYASVHHRLALVYFVHGRFTDAEFELKRAELLDPRSFSHAATLSELYYYWRRQEDSIRVARDILAVAPQFDYAHCRIGWSLMAERKYTEAEEELRKGNWKQWIAIARAARGDMDGARMLLKEFRLGPDDPGFTARPAFWTMANNREKALQALEQQYEQRDTDIASVQFDPIFDPLRGDPRFQSLVARMGFQSGPNSADVASNR